MKVVIEFEIDNAAFVENLEGETHRMLMEAERKLLSGGLDKTFLDTNGNLVGRVRVMKGRINWNKK